MQDSSGVTPAVKEGSMTIWLVATDGADSIRKYAEHIPDGVKSILLYMGIGLVALFVLWLLFTVIRALHRRAYNLTKVETAKAGGTPPPDFLTVDKEARAEAIKRGDEYVRPADREVPATTEPPMEKTWSLWGFVCRMGALVAGVGHVGVLLVSLVANTKDADTVWQDVSTAERFEAVVSRYWIGFAIAGVVIVAELVRFITSKKTKD